MANEKTNMTVHEGQVCFSIMEFSTVASVLMAVRAAIELKVFDIIADAGPEAQLSTTEIISYIPTSNPKAVERLDRMLRLLSANGFLINTSSRKSHSGTSGKRTYSLSKMSHCLLRNTEGFSMAATLLLGSSRESIESYYKLKDAVLEEGFQDYFTKAHAMTLYEFSARNPNFAQIFDETMANFSKSMLGGVLNVYKGFKDVNELMDVGGGNGTTLQQILTSQIFVELTLISPKLLILRLRSQWILHNWDDDKCKKLLKNCWDALPNNGKLIIVEFIVPEIIQNTPESQLVTAIDIHMLTCHDAKERTLAEYEGLAKSAGFLEPNDIPTIRGFHVLEFFKTGNGKSMST